MDAVFGADLFLNEMTWKRSSAHSDTRQGMRRAGKIPDVLLVYTKTGDYVWIPQYMPYTEDYQETGVPARRPGRSPLQGNGRNGGQTWGRHRIPMAR